MVRQLTVFANEVTRVALEVGTLGILGGQAKVEGVEGVWDDLTTNVNVSTSLSWLFSFYNVDQSELLTLQKMARNLTDQVREIAHVVSGHALYDPRKMDQLTCKTKSVARGDLTKTVNADVQGEILDLKVTVNDMVRDIGF